MRQVYLDNSATTAVDPAVVEEMGPFFSTDYGNPSSIHTLGQRARAAMENARRKVAALIGAQAQEIVFTSGGTESDNTVLRGAVSASKHKNSHIITTAIEHPAILRTCEELEKQGVRVSFVPVGQTGRVDPEAIKEAITDETVLISVMHVNNEIGTIQPLQEIASLAKEREILLHTDAVQSVGKIPVDVNELGVDLLSLSSHKIHGPKGIGALYVRRGVSLTPLLFGGSHERGRRAGTENVPGIVGLGKACELAGQALEDFGSRVAGLRDRLEETVLRDIPDTSVNGDRSRRVPHLTNLSFRYLEGEALLISLDLKGIAVSTGSACSSGSLQPSHVLTAIRQTPELIQGSVRFSLSRMTTDEDVDYVLQVLPDLVARMREMSPLYHRSHKG